MPARGGCGVPSFLTLSFLPGTSLGFEKGTEFRFTTMVINAILVPSLLSHFRNRAKDLPPKHIFRPKHIFEPQTTDRRRTKH